MTDAEIDAMRRFQGVAAGGRLPAAARALSWWGEHGRGWYALAVVGAVLDPRHRRTWLGAGAAAFGAHAAAVVTKRVVRRPRPADPRVEVLVATPSDLSFPSAHAASTAAAAVALSPVVGAPVAVATVGAMGAARVLLGVHYPSDVVAGAALGVVAGALVRRGTR